MLSVNLIERLFNSGRHEQLLAAVAGNGLVLPLALRIRLTQSSVAAVALGLRRTVELTYGPTSLSRAMTRRLLEWQEPDGSFGRDPAVTATAVVALRRVLSDQPQVDSDGQIVAATEQALAALASMQSAEGDAPAVLPGGFAASEDRCDRDAALTTAFVLYLLADDSAFRQAVRFADLLDWFEQHPHELDADTDRLWQMARTAPRRELHPLAA